MNLFLSLVRGGNSSSAQHASSSDRPVRSEKRIRRQANTLMDNMGRIEDRG
jgi:hypothetical protein